MHIDPFGDWQIMHKVGIAIPHRSARRGRHVRHRPQPDSILFFIRSQEDGVPINQAKAVTNFPPYSLDLIHD
jgi:hypothetical protein